MAHIRVVFMLLSCSENYVADVDEAIFAVRWWCKFDTDDGGVAC